MVVEARYEHVHFASDVTEICCTKLHVKCAPWFSHHSHLVLFHPSAPLPV